MAKLSLMSFTPASRPVRRQSFTNDSRVLGGGWIVGAERKKADAMHPALN